MNRKVNMIRYAANSETIALGFPRHRSKVGMETGAYLLIQDRTPVLGAEDQMNENKVEGLRHPDDYRSGLQSSHRVAPRTWGLAPGCYHIALTALIIALNFCVGCKTTQSNPNAPRAGAMVDPPIHYPPRPTIPPPPVKLFHQDNDTLTLTTKPDATDDEIAAILWQFRDAAHAHTFDTLHLPQKFIDARQPTVWFHVYRGSKCAAEKFIKGKLPCEASYHGAGDYTLGAYKNPQWEDAVLHNADGTETHLWDADAPPTKP